MDPTGCPPGRATDQVFDARGGECQANYAAFWGTAGTVLAVKALTVVLLLATRRRQLRAEQRVAAEQAQLMGGGAGGPDKARGAARGGRFRHTSRVAQESGMFVVYVVLFFAIGFNVATYYNAAAWAVFTVGFLGNAIAKCFSAFTMVRLSRKLLPAQFRNSPASALIDKLDAGGKAMFAVMVITTFASQVLLVVVAPIIVTTEIALAQTGLVMKGLFTICYQAILVWQLMRCIDVLKRHDLRLRGDEVPLPEEAKVRAREQLRNAIRKLRKAYVFNLVFLPGTLYYFVLAARIVPWKWWVVFLMVWVEVASTVLDAVHAGGKQSFMAVLSEQLGRRFATDDQPSPPPSDLASAAAGSRGREPADADADAARASTQTQTPALAPREVLVATQPLASLNTDFAESTASGEHAPASVVPSGGRA